MAVRRRCGALAAGLALLLAIGGCGRSPAGTPASPSVADDTVLVNDCGHGVVRPRHLVMFCGDAGVQVLGLHWSSWSDRRAVATARKVIAKNGCCATPYVLRHARVTVRRPWAFQDGTRAFTCLTIRPGLMRGRSTERVNLAASTWTAGHFDDLRGALRGCATRAH